MTILLVAFSLFAAACVSLPADPAQTSSAGYVGDRANMSLAEVIVSVQSASGSVPYSNLHVGLAAIINLKSPSRSDAFDVERIVRRMEPRISSRIVEVVLTANTVSPAQLSSLKEQISAEAQSSFDAAFNHWKDAPAWEVQLVVTSLYLTNGSVGRGTTGSRLVW